MADFYPLLSKAVSGLADPSPEKRQAIYERARNALQAQLNALDPAPDQSVIDAELTSLVQAIQRVERELAQPAPVAPPIAQAAAPARKPGIVIKPPPSRAHLMTAPVPQAAEIPAAADAQSGQPLPASENAPTAPAFTTPAPGSNYTLPPENLQPSAYSPPDPPPPTEGEGGDSAEEFSGRPRASEAFRPPKRRLGGVLALLTGLFVIIAAGGGFVAWKMRILPERFTSGQPLVAASKTADASQNASAKNTGRAAGQASKPARPVTQQTPASNTSAGAKKEPQSAASTPQAIAVAQRAALLVQPPASETDGKVRNYSGNVVWSTRNVSRGSGQPASFSVRAEVTIPDAKFKATMTIEKNSDSTLPASHMVTWRFQREEGAAIPGITEIGVLQMHNDDSRVAEPLAGAQAKITPDVYIYALAAPEALRATNMTRLEKLNWFILPVKLDDNREARVTLEKGPPGARIIAEAFRKWGVKTESPAQ